ncbi:MAG: hypothetical protein WB715_24205, partial [Roseiarcus sp.]|uniref:hypothetical protein n=1 Tax=Roseiarcus sp. TaxID=1969460 RepID=UPI003C32CD63
EHRRRRHADAREREIERIEGALGDLDQKKGRAPEEGQKGQRRIGRHGALEELEGGTRRFGRWSDLAGSQDALGRAGSALRLLYRHFTGAA